MGRSGADHDVDGALERQAELRVDLALATGYQQEALALYREIGDRGGEAEVLNSAGETLLATGQHDAGQQHRQAARARSVHP